VDVITHAKFFSDRLRDVDSVGGRKSRFRLTKPMAVNTGLATALPAIHHRPNTRNHKHREAAAKLKKGNYEQEKKDARRRGREGQIFGREKQVKKMKV